jgi:hypothetical protein
MNPSAIGRSVATAVQRALRVSFQIVSTVVLQGLCSRVKSMRFTAVSSVQPPVVTSTEPTAASSPSSSITPGAAPTVFAPSVSVSMMIVGMMISLAGTATR